MDNQIFRATDREAYRQAGATDLIELLPVKGQNSIYVVKWILETLVCGIAMGEVVHLSGPTGSAKSALLEILHKRPENLLAVLAELGFEEKKLQLYPIEMATYETPGELYQRRALKDGTTFDEKSTLIRAIAHAAKHKDQCYPLIWLREMGRVHSASVQGGLLNLITRGDIVLPNGARLDGRGIAWVADSNYQAEQDSTHTLVTFDDALRRRFSVNLTLDYLPAELEVTVLERLLADEHPGQTFANEQMTQVVHLGQAVRRYRADGNLQSVTPPTLYGYLAFFRMAQGMPQLDMQQIARVTLLGNASPEDQKLIPGLFNEVFGLQRNEEEEETLVNDLF